MLETFNLVSNFYSRRDNNHEDNSLEGASTTPNRSWSKVSYTSNPKDKRKGSKHSKELHIGTVAEEPEVQKVSVYSSMGLSHIKARNKYKEQQSMKNSLDNVDCHAASTSSKQSSNGLGHNHVSGSEGDGCNPCPGRGRGRGVNLTAWMTHGKGYEDKNIGKSKCLSPLKKDAVTSNIFNLSSKRATKVNPNDGLSIHGNSHFSCS